MHQETLSKLKAFATACNWTIPHPLDRRRFHKFIATAFEEGDHTIPLREFDRVLREYTAKGWDLDTWYREYETGIALLKVQKEG